MTLAELKATIARTGEDGCGWVGPALFFDGNDDDGSMGANLDEPGRRRPWLLGGSKHWPHPGIAAFARTLLALEQRADVTAVQLYVTDEWGDDDPDQWPYCSTVHVRGPITREALWDAVHHLFPEPFEDDEERDDGAWVVWWD